MAEKAYWLKMRRKKRGLSQKELAELSGISLRSIRAYEQGTRDIAGASVRQMGALCTALDCSAEELLLYPARRSNPYHGLSDEQLLKRYRRMVLREETSFSDREKLPLSEAVTALTEEMAARYYRLKTGN